MDALKKNDLSMFEVLYQQKLHSASKFENVSFNIPNIIDFYQLK